MTVRVRGFAYRHKVVRTYYREGVGKFAVVAQRGGRSHGAQRTVLASAVRG